MTTKLVLDSTAAQLAKISTEIFREEHELQGRKLQTAVRRETIAEQRDEVRAQIADLKKVTGSFETPKSLQEALKDSSLPEAEKREIEAKLAVHAQIKELEEKLATLSQQAQEATSQIAETTKLQKELEEKQAQQGALVAQVTTYTQRVAELTAELEAAGSQALRRALEAAIREVRRRRRAEERSLRPANVALETTRRVRAYDRGRSDSTRAHRHWQRESYRIQQRSRTGQWTPEQVREAQWRNDSRMATSDASRLAQLRQDNADLERLNEKGPQNDQERAEQRALSRTADDRAAEIARIQQQQAQRWAQAQTRWEGHVQEYDRRLANLDETSTQDDVSALRIWATTWEERRRAELNEEKAAIEAKGDNQTEEDKKRLDAINAELEANKQRLEELKCEKCDCVNCEGGKCIKTPKPAPGEPPPDETDDEKKEREEKERKEKEEKELKGDGSGTSKAAQPGAGDAGPDQSSPKQPVGGQTQTPSAGEMEVPDVDSGESSAGDSHSSAVTPDGSAEVAGTVTGDSDNSVSAEGGASTGRAKGSADNKSTVLTNSVEPTPVKDGAPAPVQPATPPGSPPTGHQPTFTGEQPPKEEETPTPPAPPSPAQPEGATDTGTDETTEQPEKKPEPTAGPAPATGPEGSGTASPLPSGGTKVRPPPDVVYDEGPLPYDASRFKIDWTGVPELPPPQYASEDDCEQKLQKLLDSLPESADPLLELWDLVKRLRVSNRQQRRMTRLTWMSRFAPYMGDRDRLLQELKRAVVEACRRTDPRHVNTRFGLYVVPSYSYAQSGPCHEEVADSLSESGRGMSDRERLDLYWRVASKLRWVGGPRLTAGMSFSIPHMTDEQVRKQLVAIGRLLAAWCTDPRRMPEPHLTISRPPPPRDYHLEQRDRFRATLNDLYYDVPQCPPLMRGAATSSRWCREGENPFHAGLVCFRSVHPAGGVGAGQQCCYYPAGHARAGRLAADHSRAGTPDSVATAIERRSDGTCRIVPWQNILHGVVDTVPALGDEAERVISGNTDAMFEYLLDHPPSGSVIETYVLGVAGERIMATKRLEKLIKEYVWGTGPMSEELRRVIEMLRRPPRMEMRPHEPSRR